MRKLMLTAAALALVPAGAALAQSFADLDANGDAVLTLAEAQAGYPALTAEGFTAIDTNADGALDEAELTAAVEAGVLQPEG